MGRFFLTGRFALLALAGIGGVALLGWAGVPVLYSAGGLAALSVAAVGIDIWQAPDPRRATVFRRVPARGRRGEPLQVLIELQNLGSRALRGSLRDFWPGQAIMRHARGKASGQPSTSRWLALSAAPGERVRLGFTLTPRRRGAMRSGVIGVRALGPMGLAGREYWHPLPTEVAVSWSPRRKIESTTQQSGDLELIAVSPSPDVGEHRDTVVRAYEELRMFAGAYGARRVAPEQAESFVDRVAAYLPGMAGDADHSGRLLTLLDHLADLFSFAQQQGSDQQQRLLLVRYADTLTKLTGLLSENYYGSILRNPEYWSEPEQRIAQVLGAIDAVDYEVVENMKQLNESRDIEFRVALDSLTRFQSNAKLSDAYGTGEPDHRQQPS